ncbi:MAG: hypothetical protein ACXWVC_09615 [Rhodoplanes sp.]
MLSLDNDSAGGEARDQSVAVREIAARSAERHFGVRHACRQDALFNRANPFHGADEEDDDL